MGGTICRNGRLGPSLIDGRFRQAGRARRGRRRRFRRQDDGHSRHARNSLQRSLGRIAHRGVGGRLATIDLQRETRAVVGHDQALDKAGGDQPLARQGVDDGVQSGDDGGAFDQDDLPEGLQAIRRAFYRRPSPAASLDLPKPPSVTLLAGPTASGKSAWALKMALETGAVIINADSQQLYADLRILTARPSPEHEALVDHRLYGVVDAAEAWSVGKWSRAVLDLLAELRDEGRPAILVGGTGLYFMALTRGLAEIPPVPSSVRDRTEADYLQDGEAAFRQRLAEVDPASALAIEQGDRQRLVRAMSVHAATGRTISAWKAETRPLLSPSDWTGLVIEPERARLYENCDRRVDQMMDESVLTEIRALMQRNLDPTLPVMKAVGLRELTAHLSGETDISTAVAALKQATRNYAKRQLTWFRNQTAEWSRIQGP